MGPVVHHYLIMWWHNTQQQHHYALSAQNSLLTTRTFADKMPGRSLLLHTVYLPQHVCVALCSVQYNGHCSPHYDANDHANMCKHGFNMSFFINVKRHSLSTYLLSILSQFMTATCNPHKTCMQMYSTYATCTSMQKFHRAQQSFMMR